MTSKSEWLAALQQDVEDIKQLVHDFHPQVLRLSPWTVSHDPMTITAPGAEMARREIVTEMRETGHLVPDPEKRFDEALVNGDVGALMSVMNGAWFGVPKSTSCNDIPGFEAMCDLLSDPPDDDEVIVPSDPNG